MDEYFEWLFDGLEISNSYKELCAYLHTIPFCWTIEHDENRAGDGLEYRAKFVAAGGHIPKNLKGCTFFELLVGLADRVTWEMTGFYPDTRGDWFVTRLYDAGLVFKNDEFEKYPLKTKAKVSTIVRRIMNRTYKPDGQGGLFYIENYVDDMRELELWVQLAHWCLAHT